METFSVAILDDDVAEEDETFVVRLSGAEGAEISEGEATVTILDNDESALVVEPTALTASGGDYAGMTATVTEESAVTYTVALTSMPSTNVTGVEDDDAEDETVTLRHSASEDIVVTVTDNDAAEPTFYIENIRVNEGASAAVFTVSLSPPSAVEVTATYATEDITATARLDYVPKENTLTFAPGETRKTIKVELLDDTVHEADETFQIRLSAAEGVRHDHR